MWGKGSASSLCMGASNWPSTMCWEGHLSTLSALSTPFWKPTDHTCYLFSGITIDATWPQILQGIFVDSRSILRSMCLSLRQYHTVRKLWNREVHVLQLCSFSRLQSTRQFLINFRLSFSIFSTKATGILIRFTFNVSCSGWYRCFNSIKHSIHEPRTSSCLFRSIFISFTSALQHNSLARLILKYFILSDSTVNGIVLLILLLDCLSLMSKNTTGFCVCILYPATLLNSFISYNFLVIFRIFYKEFSVSDG